MGQQTGSGAREHRCHRERKQSHGASLPTVGPYGALLTVLCAGSRRGATVIPRRGPGTTGHGSSRFKGRLDFAPIDDSNPAASGQFVGGNELELSAKSGGR